MSTVAANITAVTSLDATTSDRTAEAARCILFFDGVCGLCNKAVDFVLAHDPEGHFQFAPLQGETARQLLSPADAANLNSMVLILRGRSYRKSAAAVRILWQFSWPWRCLGSLLWLIPLPIRNHGYDLVSRNRYRFFGRHETCRMPTASERARFLP